jgi:hypothetical protein
MAHSINSSYNMLTRSKAYAVGDIAYSRNLPSYLRLECVAAGTTGTTEPSYSTPTAGQYITDGTAIFLLTDIRDGLMVGDIKLSPILRPGYVKANGALLSNARANYPRLVAFITANPSLNAADDTEWNSNKALYVYDSSADTLRVPDATGRVLQGENVVSTVDAGVPNITGVAPLVIAGSTYNAGVFLDTPSGAFQDRGSSVIGKMQTAGGTTGTLNAALAFNASKSNSIYGSSTTVQPPALTLIPQIKY